MGEKQARCEMRCSDHRLQCDPGERPHGIQHWCPPNSRGTKFGHGFFKATALDHDRSEAHDHGLVPLRDDTKPTKTPPSLPAPRRRHMMTDKELDDLIQSRYPPVPIRFHDAVIRMPDGSAGQIHAGLFDRNRGKFSDILVTDPIDDAIDPQDDGAIETTAKRTPSKLSKKSDEPTT